MSSWDIRQCVYCNCLLTKLRSRKFQSYTYISNNQAVFHMITVAKKWHMISFLNFALCLFSFVIFVLFFYFFILFILFSFCIHFVHVHYLIFLILFFHLSFVFISFRFLKWDQEKTTWPRTDTLFMPEERPWSKYYFSSRNMVPGLPCFDAISA